jgi:tetratricopeptide (TPR) repeat protein
MPVATAIERCNALVSRAAGDRKAVALILCALTQLHAMEGDFDRAREANAAARAHLEEIGSKVLAASTALDAGVAELLAGRPGVAEKVLLSDYAALEAVGERSLRSTMAGLLGLALYDLGRDEEAERFSRVSEGEATSEDRESQALWRRVRAKVLARSGAVEESQRLAREAVAVTRETDSPVLQADALADLAEVLSLTQAPEEAAETFQEALTLYRQKGNVPATDRTEASLRRLLASTASV